MVVVAMRKRLCGKDFELQNLTVDGHIRLCALAVVLSRYVATRLAMLRQAVAEETAAVSATAAVCELFHGAGGTRCSSAARRGR